MEILPKARLDVHKFVFYICVDGVAGCGLPVLYAEYGDVAQGKATATKQQ
jgi:hypothetical protein